MNCFNIQTLPSEEKIMSELVPPSKPLNEGAVIIPLPNRKHQSDNIGGLGGSTQGALDTKDMRNIIVQLMILMRH